jgi:uncharacterized protein YqfB (UPF0267 family)
MRTLTAFDVDTDALADTFDRMADGLRSDDVLVERLESGHVADAGDHSEFRFDMEFKTTHGFVDVTDPIAYDANHYLRFTDDRVTPILSGEKFATVRVGFERDFDVGDVVDLIDDDRDKFADATIESIRQASILELSNDLRGVSATSMQQLIRTLNDHYDDVDKRTTATAFRFQVRDGPDNPDGSDE